VWCKFGHVTPFILGGTKPSQPTVWQQSQAGCPSGLAKQLGAPGAFPLKVDGCVQGYLAHKKPHPPRTLQQDYAYGPTAVLGVGAFSYGRGTPVPRIQHVDLRKVGHWFRGGLVFEAHRLCVSRNSRLESNKAEEVSLRF